MDGDSRAWTMNTIAPWGYDATKQGRELFLVEEYVTRWVWAIMVCCENYVHVKMLTHMIHKMTWWRWPVNGVLELVRVELASMWLCRRANHSTHLFPWNLARASDLLENFAGKILEAANEDQDHQSREWIHDERINVGFSTECRVLPIICMGKGFLLALCSM